MMRTEGIVAVPPVRRQQPDHGTLVIRGAATSIYGFPCPHRCRFSLGVILPGNSAAPVIVSD